MWTAGANVAIHEFQNFAEIFFQLLKKTAQVGTSHLAASLNQNEPGRRAREIDLPRFGISIPQTVFTAEQIAEMHNRYEIFRGSRGFDVVVILQDGDDIGRKIPGLPRMRPLSA